MIKKRLTKNEIEKIKSLVRSGKSLNYISQLMSKSKTTIYYYSKQIKGPMYFPIKINFKDMEPIGEFMGLFAGDGNFHKTKQYHYRVYLFFGPDEKEFMEKIEFLLFKLFNKKPIRSQRKNLLILYYCSKELIQFIKSYLLWDKNTKKTYSVHLMHRDYPDQFKIGFLRGNVDSDGYISEKKIIFDSVSGKLIEDIMFFLDYFDISYGHYIYNDSRGNRKPIHHVNIRKKDHLKFLKLVKPKNIKKRKI